MSDSAVRGGEARPLVVDLHGAVTATSPLWEQILTFVRAHPLAWLRLLGWLLPGVAHLGQRLARAVVLDPVALPYREDVVAFLREEKRRGRTILLVTDGDVSLAERVSAHLGLFSGVIASDGVPDPLRDAKLAAIRARCPEAFDYLGDPSTDRVVWAACRDAYHCGGRVRRSLPADRRDPARRFPASRTALATAARALRPHQWAKNLLLCVPVAAAHRLATPEPIWALGAALVVFSLAASAGYIVNDLLDLGADRLHPSKRRRPLASGALSIPAALGLLSVTLLSGIAVAIVAELPPAFLALLGGYLATSIGYSVYFKRKALVDVIMLAALYTVRIVAGGIATRTEVSAWLLAFSMFFFLSLAFVKRYTDLRAAAGDGVQALPGRAYVSTDAPLLLGLGPASGFLSVLVLALYINSSKVVTYYSAPELLWFACVLLLYWLMRVWFLAHRGLLPADPVAFALRDWNSLVTALLLVLLLVVASFWRIGSP